MAIEKKPIKGEKVLVGMFKDAFGNTATIEKETIIPYRGAKKAELAYKLSLTADYDFDYLYHVSVHDSEEAALSKMEEFSGNTWQAAHNAIDER